MADTIQIVSWSLERKCDFRSGDDWFLPSQTCRQLADLRAIAFAESERRIVNGICVTSWTTEQDHARKYHDIPYSGFRIEDRLGPVGGLTAALAICRACEANVSTEPGIDVAGCFGYLDVWPDSDELDQQLWNIIRQRDLESRLRTAFPLTTPLWYGFWINSPLRRVQAEFLHEVLDAAWNQDDPKNTDVRDFIKALKAAVSWELPVHVSLNPLGHTDFGMYTIFPHCPRCKANAPVDQWQESYTKEPHDCHVCGHTFIPDEHHSSENDDWQDNQLEKQLGDAGYQSFVRAFLLHRGCTPEKADEVLDKKNNGELLRRIKKVRKRRNARLMQLRESGVLHSADPPPPTRTVALAHGIDMTLVLIPAGEFLMGSEGAEENPNHAPVHLVRIARPFYIGQFPVTQNQWAAVMGKNSSKHKGDPNLPVETASWFDAQEFCDRLCQHHAQVFRLPSEAEWEYACRAGTTTKYAFGNTLLPSQANFTPDTTRCGPPPSSESEFISEREFEVETIEALGRRESRLTPVGSYPPNAWGVFDMHGNAGEWCEDVWHPNYDGAPPDGSAWLDGEGREPSRVLRGGSAAAGEILCASSARQELRGDAGSLEEDGVDGEEDGDWFMAAVRDLLCTPCGFRVVCEYR